jgi:hypothetical protein
MNHSCLLAVVLALFSSLSQADADPLNCVKDPIPTSEPTGFSIVLHSFNVPGSGAIIYREVTNCYSVGATAATRTWCRVGQDHDPNRYPCGTGVPTGCNLDSFVVFAVTYTAQPDQSSHRICVTVRNSQPANPRYFDFYVEEQYVPS